MARLDMTITLRNVGVKNATKIYQNDLFKLMDKYGLKSASVLIGQNNIETSKNQVKVN